ncbi:hemicentin-1-like [Haemaphysalis longicornis]
MDVALRVGNALAMVVRKPDAGRWQIRAASADGVRSVRATGVSATGFRHGFSQEPADEMRHTQRAPMRGMPSYVLVNSSSDAVLKELQLLSVRGDRLAKLSLSPVPQRRHMYSSSTSFVPPDDLFFLKVVGTDSAGFPMNRLTTTAIKSEVPVPPQIEKAAQEVYKIVENAPFSLHCHSSGSPPPVLEWRKDGRKVTVLHNLGIQISPEGDSLNVASAKLLHEGFYKCVAMNAAGSMERDFLIHILLPPQIQGPAHEVVRVVEGQEVTLSCRVAGTPQPSSSFLRDGVSWPSDDRGDGRRELFIAAAAADRDSGVYVCRATSEAGSAQKTFQLVVLASPRKCTRKPGAPESHPAPYR